MYLTSETAAPDAAKSSASPPLMRHCERSQNELVTCLQSWELQEIVLHVYFAKFHSVQLHLRHKRTDEQTNKRTNGQTDGRTDAGNRIWCILALKCDIWWHKF